jgi:hypothetical protein
VQINVNESIWLLQCLEFLLAGAPEDGRYLRNVAWHPTAADTGTRTGTGTPHPEPDIPSSVLGMPRPALQAPGSAATSGAVPPGVEIQEMDSVREGG